MSSTIFGVRRKHPFSGFFGRMTLIWIALSIILFSVLGYMYFSNGLHRSSSDTPGWLQIIGALLAFIWIPITAFTFVQIRQDQESPNLNTRHFAALAMCGSVAILGGCIIIMFACARPSATEPPAVTSRAILIDSSLFHYGSAGNESAYSIVSDSMSVEDMDSATYLRARHGFRHALFQQADKKLLLSGYPKIGQVIEKLLTGSERDHVILEELHKRRYFFYDESIHTADSGYIFRATLCLAKDRSLDSTIDVIVRNHCIRWTIYDKLLNGPIPQNGLEVSLQQIVETVCKGCPNLPFVKLITAHCGGSLSCDSVYFESGKYQLSDASRIVLERFYFEFLQKYPDQYIIDLYGFTDARPIKDPIDYNGDGRYTGLFTLLPSINIQDTALQKIFNNEQLSFARAFSCYEFIRQMFPRQTNTVHYTGGGKANFIGGDQHQRTVKLVITKK